MNWQSLLGKFSVDRGVIRFEGEEVEYAGKPTPAVGNLISDQRLVSGRVKARVRFDQVSDVNGCGLLLFFEPSAPFFLTAQLGAGPSMFSVQTYLGGRWQIHESAGDRANLQNKRDYALEVVVVGSRLTFSVDGVDVIRATLPFVPPNGQVGIWCLDTSPIRITGFSVDSVTPKAFVVMQFTKPYNELYSEVIRPVCQSEGVEPLRADEEYGPGLIIADIARQIAEAHFVVAEISPANPNVYYELGYAHALNKPTILIAEQGTDLPFDVSPFRILFYENSIEGKRKIEEGFRKHLQAILSE